MRIAAIVGHSGSGKTTLIVALIRHFAARGERVAAIKHTHHPLNEERRGDTFAFQSAGAEPVLFAGEHEAVIFERGGTRRISFGPPGELLAHAAADIVLVEGFKSFEGWPRIDLERGRRVSLEEALSILSRIWPALP